MEMKTRLLILLAPLALVALLAAGCGGGGGNGNVPNDSVATVGGTPVTKSTFNALMAVAFAKYKAQGQAEPKVGTPAYTQLRDQAVGFLVQEDELQQEGKKLGVTVSQKDIDARLAQIKKSYGEKKFAAALKGAHITLPQYEQYSLEPTLLGEKLQNKVTSNVKITKSAAQKYYAANKQAFTTPETREVRHILVSSKTLANTIETKLKHGGDFAQLAKQYSKDTTSAKVGGKLCVAHGGSSGACQQTVPPFDKASFSLKTHEISQPVKSVYGYHIIQALSAIKPAHTQTFSQVSSQIQLNLAQQKKQVAWSNWLAKVKKDYEKKVSYQSGYAPATTTTPTVSTPATTTG
jgi:parvulin-like peptidyl-prolyl isomerase